MDTSAPQRVEQKASSSNSPTSPRVIKGTKLIHQRVTRSNTPIPTIMEVEEPPRDHQVTKRKGNTNSKARRPILPPFALPQRKTKSRKVNGILIDSKRNSVKNASRRRIQTLIEMQNASDRVEKLREPIKTIVCKTPQDWQKIEFNAPSPKGSAPPPFQIT